MATSLVVTFFIILDVVWRKSELITQSKLSADHNQMMATLFLSFFPQQLKKIENIENPSKQKHHH